MSRPEATFSDAPGPSLREQVERASLAARALLPIRFFFGLTFVYAGADKLLDPAFFDPNNPGSIVGQLHAFTRVSPLAPLIRPFEPFAIPLGLLIAIAEIAIGLGALTGLAFRLAAFGGAALSILFWLTASWTTHPYYYGADLPYAFGWIALTIAGTADLLVPTFVRELGMPAIDDWDRARLGAIRGGMRPRGQLFEPEVSASRRLILQAGVLGTAALAVASLAVPMRLVRGESAEGDAGSALGGASDGTGDTGVTATDGTALGGDPTPEESPEASADDTSPSPTSPTTAFRPSGLTVASVAAVDQKGAIRIRVPTDAPISLPAGDPAIVIKLASGKYVCYDATCTHEGCRVGWDARDGVMLCPCHGAAFDPTNHGAVLGGPTNTPLLELPIVIDHQAGTITLKA